MRSHAKAPSAGSVWTAAAALILGVAFLAIASQPAFAAVGHSVVRTFSTGPNTNPGSLATDSDGNVYVLDMGARRIDKFNAAGHRIPFTGSAGYIGETALTGTSSEPLDIGPNAGHSNIAVDRSGGPADGTIFLSAEGNSFVGATYVFAPTGTYRGELRKSREFATCGVAVSPASGEVYVAKSSGVLRYPAPTERLNVVEPNGETQIYTCALAVDSADALYVISGFEPHVLKYDASQFGVPSPFPTWERPLVSKALAVDPTDDDLYVNDGSHIVRFDSAGAQLGAPFGDLANSTGVTTAVNGDILATDAAGGVYVYGPAEVQLPKATTGGSANVTAKSAEVEGSVDPDGAGDITSCEIRYGEDSGYADGSVPCTPGGTISSPTAVGANLSGLVSGTTYHYRVFATNANGTQMASSEQTFTTASGAVEGVTTEAASAIQKDSATLNGSFSGDGQEAHYFFEWGATTAYGHTTGGASAGSGSGPQTVAPVAISGLHGDTVYHYRLVVSDPDGISRGQDQTFTTPPPVANLTADAATGITDSGAELHASFDGDATYETHYYFEWGTTLDYGNTSPAPPGTGVAAGAGRIDVPAVSLAGLDHGTKYHYRVVASNATGISISADATFKTAEAPLVSNISTREVTATSAVLTGEVNPRSSNTTYRFEWGPSTAYGNSIPVPNGNAGSGAAAVPVSAQLSSLSAGVTYHFRLVATNQYGSASSVDQAFGFYPSNCPNAQIRQETRSNGLPDCRAYELVTPGFQNGATIFPVNAPSTGYATNPAKIAYSVDFGTFSDEGQANGTGDMEVSTRSDTGWYQKFIGLPATESPVTAGPPLDWMTAWQTGKRLGSAIYSFYGTQVSPNLDRMIVYANGWPSDIGQRGTEVSNAPYLFETSTGKGLGRWPTNLDQIAGGRGFVGVPHASPDFSHFIFSSNVVFSDDGRGQASAKSIECCPTSESTNPMPKGPIYDNDVRTGTVKLASLKSDNTTEFEGYVYDISDDGSRILMGEQGKPFFDKQTPVTLTGPLYLRVDAERTYEIAPGRQLRYVGSTDDGSTLYFTSPEQLTADDHDSSVDLFRWRESEPSGLTRISAGTGGSGNSDSCSASWIDKCGVGIINFFPYTERQGGDGGNGLADPYIAGLTDTFIAGDSGDIYFESPERLLGSKGEPGQVNLYLFRHDSLRFVTTMSPDHNCEIICYPFFCQFSVCTDGPVSRMQITPSGDHMALVTNSNLTDYDSQLHREMYTFDPESGQIVCASCRPDGKPPVSDTYGSQSGLFLANDGRTFFSTVDPLMPRDTNERRDVYEYTEGRPQLITTGLGVETYGTIEPIQGQLTKPGLLGVSANGTDVYFETSESLVTQDHNGQQLKIYDARIGGGFPADPTPPNCEAADECHGPSSGAPALPPDRTSGNLGAPRKQKAAKHKAKRHRKARKHRKKRKNTHAAKAKGRGHRG